MVFFCFFFGRIRFRNYVPVNEELRRSVVKRTEVPQLAAELNKKLEELVAVDPDYAVSDFLKNIQLLMNNSNDSN